MRCDPRVALRDSNSSSRTIFWSLWRQGPPQMLYIESSSQLFDRKAMLVVSQARSCSAAKERSMRHGHLIPR